MQDKQQVIEHIRQAFATPSVPVTLFCREAARAASLVSRSRRSSVSPIGRNSVPWSLMPVTMH